MAHRVRVGIVFGGRSAEHEVSLQSARNIIDAIDRTKYDPVLIGIGRDGRWLLTDEDHPFLNERDAGAIRLDTGRDEVTLVAGPSRGRIVGLGEGNVRDGSVPDGSIHDGSVPEGVDVLFPVLHGPYGEDGSMQGLAKLANLPCVGSDILGSAVGMDKDVSKRLLRFAGIATADHLVLRRSDLRWIDRVSTGGVGHGGSGDRSGSGDTGVGDGEDDQARVLRLPKDVDTSLSDVERRLAGAAASAAVAGAADSPYPLFVKPANMGSSVGVSMATDRRELYEALVRAFAYDRKVLVERTVTGREIECAVLGNDDPIVSQPGEIVPTGEFYSYEAKYLDENGALLAIPADCDDVATAELRRVALEAFRVLECRGMARVDMFLAADGTVYVNEVNTIPGFTRNSMYPKLWEAAGVSYAELIDRLIGLAREDFEARGALRSER